MENNALSYSSLSKFNQCPLQFARVKAIQERMADYSQDSARGTIIHRYMEDLINDYMLQGRWMDINDAKDLMNDLWNNGFMTKEDDTLNILEAPEWDSQFLEKSIDDSMLLVPMIYEEILPTLSPIATESYKRIPLVKGGKQYKYLHGVIDCVNSNGSIIDWKTSKSERRQEMSEYDLQATVYAALTENVRTSVHFVQFIYLKRNAPRIVWDSTKRDQRHVDWLMNDYIPQVMAQIEADIYPPTPGWHCKWCPTPCNVDPNKLGAW